MIYVKAQKLKREDVVMECGVDVMARILGQVAGANEKNG